MGRMGDRADEGDRGKMRKWGTSYIFSIMKIWLARKAALSITSVSKNLEEFCRQGILNIRLAAKV
jgi:hypothetical protein